MNLDKPKVIEVLPLVNACYLRSIVGCCLHIVLDDDNVEDRSVDFCVEYAREEGCEDCISLAKLLRRMTPTQRKKLAHEKDPASSAKKDWEDFVRNDFHRLSRCSWTVEGNVWRWTLVEGKWFLRFNEDYVALALAERLDRQETEDLLREKGLI